MILEALMLAQAAQIGELKPLRVNSAAEAMQKVYVYEWKDHKTGCEWLVFKARESDIIVEPRLVAGKGSRQLCRRD